MALIHRLLRCAPSVALLIACACVCAPTSATQVVPGPLRDWQDWAMHGHDALRCPAQQPDSDLRTCLFASALRLDIGSDGARFAVRASVHGTEALLPLPGEAGAWPTDTTVNGRPAVIVSQDGRPVIALPPGRHDIAGRLDWRHMPGRLSISPLYASIEVRRDGVLLQPDAAGHIWLAQAQGDAREADSERLRVFRRLSDDIPFRVDTRFELQVSGAAREIRLPAAVLPGFDALSIDSPLPARLDGDGNLQVQARAGSHVVTVTGQRATPAARLDLPAGGSAEIWSFEARHALRRVDVEGGQAIDPRQAGVPADWQALPAWQLAAGTGLAFAERTRGDSAPVPDTLSLSRQLWLDMDGQGLSFQDRIQGSVNRSWRLSAHAPLEPGRVSLGGQDQYLTRLPAHLGQRDAGGPGIEVRQGRIDLVADGRLADPSADIPAAGWSADFEQVSATLHLPPGWRLLHASGVDSAHGAWLARWSLWDFFFVLLISTAALRVFGLPAALALGGALVMSWHLPDAPGWLWLLVIGFAALQDKAQPAGRLGRFVARGRILSLIVLALAWLPFAVDQAREALYPSLELPYQSAPGGQAGEPYAAPVPAAAPAVAMGETMRSESYDSLPRKAMPPPPPKPSRYDAVDPGARVQTGPGLPTWQWHAAQLGWSGPVQATQHFRLWLSPPFLTRLGTLSMLALMGAALWLVAGRPRRLADLIPARMAGSVAALLLALTLLPTDTAQAQPPAADTARTEAPRLDGAPSPELLDELRRRIGAPPACAPDCAHIHALALRARGNAVTLRLDIHARGPVVLPLPGGPAWRTATHTLSSGTPELARDADGTVWLYLTVGTHTLTRTLDAAAIDALQVALPAPVGAVALDLDGWTASGIDAAGQVADTLLVTRSTEASGALAADAARQAVIAPAVHITRTLTLGQRWQVDTVIERVGEGRAPIDVAVALLEGEAVTDAGVTVSGHTATLTLPEGRGARFSADLAQQDTLVLTASTRARQTEVWLLDVSPAWHVTMDGIPPVHRAAQGAYLPRWQPWPGEVLTLQVARPEGVPGPTVTLDSVALKVRPGRQASDLSADLVLRSSLGGTHRLTLPAGAELLGFSLDGEAQPVYLENGAVPVPLRPGTRTVTLNWRQPDTLGTVYTLPQLDLRQPAVNALLTLEVPQDRWVLLTGGPAFGPGVLFWGVALVLVLAAIAVSRLRLVPISTASWVLLAIGTGQSSLFAVSMTGGFLLLMGLRERMGARLRPLAFNLLQIVLVLLGLMAAGALFEALRTGLLGQPGMMVAGNASSDALLRWYADRIDGLTPEAWLLSVPLWVWRGLMLLWALWLATSVLGWAKWVWQAWSTDGVWKKGALSRTPQPMPPDDAQPPQA